MAKEKTNQETMSCPVARIFSELEKTCGRKSTFLITFTSLKSNF